MVRTLLWLQTATPDKVADTVPPDYLLGDRALYVAAFAKFKPAISPDGLFTKEGAENTLKFLAAFNPAVKPDAIKLDETYDNSYVQKALAKYKK
jgi:NitT/TauT family transport system substrate-binding protein